jgi:hypothetical protein
MVEGTRSRRKVSLNSRRASEAGPRPGRLAGGRSPSTTWHDRVTTGVRALPNGVRLLQAAPRAVVPDQRGSSDPRCSFPCGSPSGCGDRMSADVSAGRVVLQKSAGGALVGEVCVSDHAAETT